MTDRPLSHCDLPELLDAPTDISVIEDPPLRSLRDVMEWPTLLALYHGRKTPIVFNDARVKITVVAPESIGIATIYDFDVVIGIASLIRDMIEAGLEVSPRIMVTPSRLLKVIGRGDGGKDYRSLADSIRRLRMTTIVTDIRSDDGAGIERPFSWLMDYEIPTRRGPAATPDDHRREVNGARPWILHLHPWVFFAIARGRDLLAIHPFYWRLGAIERALYCLARKSVPGPKLGAGEVFAWRLATLFRRLGIRRPMSAFIADLRKIVLLNRLPEYRLNLSTRHGHTLLVMSRDHSRPPRPRRGIFKPQANDEADL